MKTRKLNLIYSLFIVALFCSFTSPEPQQKDALDLGSATNRIASGQLKIYKQVRAGFGEDFAFDGLKLKVTSYTFAHASKNGNPYLENVLGNQFTPSFKARISQVKPGDFIIFSGITVKGDGWKFNRTINSAVYTVY